MTSTALALGGGPVRAPGVTGSDATGAGGAAGPASTTTGGAFAVADAVASLLPRRQRSKRTDRAAKRNRTTTATQIGKP